MRVTQQHEYLEAAEFDADDDVKNIVRNKGQAFQDGLAALLSKLPRGGYFGFEIHQYSVLLAWLMEQKMLDVDFNNLTSAIARVNAAEEKDKKKGEAEEDWQFYPGMEGIPRFQIVPSGSSL